MTSDNPKKEWGTYGYVVFTTAQSTSLTPPTGYHFCALQITTAGALTTLTVSPNTAAAGLSTRDFSDLTTIPAGIVLYGELTAFTPDGTIEGIAYLGRKGDA